MSDPFYTKTVTIFNQYKGDGVWDDETWYPTVLTGVRILETAGANITNSGLADIDTAKLFIRTDSLDKPYMDPIAWSDLLDKESAFTLAGGKDFFVMGDASMEDVTIPEFFSYMKAKYDSVYHITNVDKYELIPHFEVGGR